MNKTLQDLLLDFDELSDAEAESLALHKYLELYTSREVRSGLIGELETHDDNKVIFFEDRFEHAFRTSADGKYSSLEKNIFSKDRGSRVHWIGPILRGEIENTVWYPFPDGRLRIKRLYVLWDENYMIWLEPRKDKEWKFSSAYTAPASYIRRTVKGLVCKKISRD